MILFGIIMKLIQNIKQVLTVNIAWEILLLCAINLGMMHYYLFLSDCLEAEDSFTLYVDNVLGIIIDVSFLFAFCFLITFRRLKVALGITFFITLIWSLCNVMYSRFFHHYISLSAIGQGGSLFDWQMIRCVLEGFEWFDLFYVISFCLFLFLIKKRFTEKRFLIRIFACLLIMTFIDIFSYVLFCSLKTEYRFLEYISQRIENRHFSEFLHLCDYNHSTFRRGCVRTIAHDLLIDLRGPLRLDEKQVRMIEAEAAISRNSMYNQRMVKPSTNVIFIIVESYMSFVSDLKIAGKEVTPFLNSLKRDSSVYYNGKMQENVTIGESSDGQFIYMTGILPLRSTITVSKVRHMVLPGLPKAINRKSRMVIPTVASMWLQDEMCRQYGIDNLYTSNDYDEENDGVLNDEQVFQLAMQADDLSDEPFFSVILTMSMHQPFTHQIDSTFRIVDSSIPTDLTSYLSACHYTDKQINKYFEHLKRKGLYENSLIIIAADHPVHNYDFGGVRKDIPLYLINAGIDPKEIYQGECSQIDVYTTLLDLLGCQKEWCGLGCSLLSPMYKNHVSSKKWNISEWIIRSHYFE